MEKLKFISNRVLALGLAVHTFLVLSVGVEAYFVVKGQLALGWVLLEIFVLILFSLLAWEGIVKPYLASEKLTKRFLEGYFYPDSEGFEEAILTPYTHMEMERLDKIFHSTQLFDLNKRQAQYLALQNQINPHFLYNTLESIRGEALIAGLDSVADMTEALAKFFRYTITKVENLVSVEDELQNCETYFSIQQYRFGSRLKLHIDYNEDEKDEIMSCRIPKLTLQPILENSIIHGTELKIGTGNLRIQFERTQKRLIIRISDDGVGMDEETLFALNQKLGRDGTHLAINANGEEGGIALANVNNRIHLIFGEEYGMHVYSVLQKGTDVEITLPVIFRDQDVRNPQLL